MYIKILLTIFMLSLALTIAFLGFTTPFDVGPIGVLFVFILFYVLFVCIVAVSSYVIRKIYESVTKKNSSSGRNAKEASLYYASVVSLGPVMLLAMHSVGEVGLYDVALIVLFVSILMFYVYKRLN